MELPDLTDLTVDEQKNELENLGKQKLKELREREERQTAIDNIDRELSSRQKSDRPKDSKDPREHEGSGPMVDESVEGSRSELERKVDYLIEECKTTSHEGFKDYEQ